MRVGFFGVGLMGAPMVERLAMGGHEVMVFNRTRDKAEAIRNGKVSAAGSPLEAVRFGECIILMLADFTAIDETLLRPECLEALKDKSVIQMGTISPGQSLEADEKVRAAGGRYLECPVLGSIGQARSGTLLLMAGGDEEVFLDLKWILDRFGPSPRLIGPVGHGAAIKLAMNQLIAAHMAAFSLSLGYIQKSGVDLDKFLSILRESALNAKMFDNKLPRLLERKYDNPNFPAKHLLKDVDLFLGEAQKSGLDAAALAAIKGILEKTIDSGGGEDDYSSVFERIFSG